MELVELLSKRAGSREIRNAAALFVSSPELREHVPALIESTDRRTSINALWMLTQLPRKESDWLQSLRDCFIDMLLRETDVTRKRILMQLLRNLRYDKEELRSDFLDFCLSKINSETEPYAIRSYSIYCAWKMCRHFPELRAELSELLSMLSVQKLSPGLRCAMKKVRAKLNSYE